MGRLLGIVGVLGSLLLGSGALNASAAGGVFNGLTPARILDTRFGTGAPQAPLQANGSINLLVSGRGGVPSSGVAAVILNVTATRVSADGFMTVWPTGAALPTASNLNYSAGQTIANLVQVGVGSGGQVSLYSSSTVDVIADVAGWVDSGAAAPRGLFNPVVPTRLLDTRFGTGGSTLGPGGVITLTTVGTGGVPASGVSAVVLNLTATNPSGTGFVTAWPHGQPMPNASNLNFEAGQTVPNRAVVAVGAGGAIDLYNAHGTVDLIADISGWFTDATASSGAPFIGLLPTRILDTRFAGGTLVSGSTRKVVVAGQAGVPAMGGTGSPSAIVANVTVTRTTGSGFLTAYPHGASRPNASDLNWTAGRTVPNLVVVALGPAGAVDFYNSWGSTDLIVDVVGYYVGAPLALPLDPPLPAMIDLINGDRAAAGVPALQWADCLGSVAQTESARQAAQGFISHANGVYADLACGYHVSGENVGWTSTGIDDALLNQLFMNSPGHRANILNPAFTVVGTAWAVAPNGAGYVTEEFAGP